MRIFSVLSLLCCLLVGCGPRIPNVGNPHQIVVDGKPMTAMAFLDKYCQGYDTHPTCAAVTRAMVIDAVHGPMAKGW